MYQTSVLKEDLTKKTFWAKSGKYSELVSPYTKEVLAKIPLATIDEIKEAIGAAHSAKAILSRMSLFERATVLEKVSELLKLRKEEAARVIALEAAKPYTTALGEVERTIETYKFAAEETKQIHGETIPLDAAKNGAGKIGYTLKKSLGVIGAITPFNFPMNLVAHKIGPAIASGNPVVLKPASQTPLSAFFISDLFYEAGLPTNALVVVTGKGSIIGDTLVNDDRIEMITFTGSPEVGISLRQKAGLKRVTLELGSNSAVIVDNKKNIDGIVKKCVFGSFVNQGQVCISLQRIYVHKDIYDLFVEKFVSETQGLNVGDPLDPETNVSSLISENETDRCLNWVNEAIEQGAQLATGGRKQEGILLPTVLLHANADAKVSCEEVFGPIVVINKISSVEEGIRRVNDSRYGLQAGIFTDKVNFALKAAEELEVGGVMINDIPTFRVDNMPYGGLKESGTGREGIKFAIEEMTELKLVVWNAG
ncbi:aldehyde dehydrogenase family protein [Shouchella rhizosphaerae]|uniref:aldehyde dehydrogenase family protein n=1 Tax=Shouchella rhizosphaerae TaxID=866786 RepID=UPI003F7D6EFC